MKKLIILTLALLLLAGISVSAAEGGGMEDGFSIEEMPEFGAVDELVFLPEETIPPAETAPLPGQDGSPKEDPTEPGAESLTSRAEESSPSPEEAADSGAGKSSPDEEAKLPDSAPGAAGQTNAPVVITVVVVLAAGAVTVMLLRKNKDTRKDD